jgi:alpha 1,2-mannosyltransferase
MSSFISPYTSCPIATLPTHHDGTNVSTSTLGTPLRHRANATFVMLARNSDVEGTVQAVRGMEDRFNRNYNYPWVFLNEKPFTNDFKRCVVPLPPYSSYHEFSVCTNSRVSHISRVSFLASGDVYFGLIPEEHWYQPSWINETKAKEERDKMQEENIIYGGSVSYGPPH